MNMNEKKQITLKPVCDNHLLYWPPIENIDDVSELAPSLAWFFGSWYNSITIPTIQPIAPKDVKASGVAGSHALADIDKIVVSHFASDAVKRLLYRGSDRVIWTSNIKDEMQFGPGKPLLGSRTLQALQGDRAIYNYYYVGEPKRNSEEAFLKATFSYWKQGGEDGTLLDKSKQALVTIKKRVFKNEEVNLFGTGPSLSESENKSFAGALNIVCNSIIKDHAWILENQPTLIIAADAHFHFSYHKYTEYFLQDLLFALEAIPSAYFVTFDKFAPLLLSKVPSIADRIIGLPSSRQSYGFNLDEEFAVFPGDSVLNMFMMPIGTFIGRNLSLHGFTGRAPTDHFFWGHSNRFQYSDSMSSVRSAHPAFFSKDFSAYNSKVEHDLEVRVEAARANGVNVESRTRTFYKPLLREKSV